MYVCVCVWEKHEITAGLKLCKSNKFQLLKKFWTNICQIKNFPSLHFIKCVGNFFCNFQLLVFEIVRSYEDGLTEV